ncbi:MAG TPA: PH domain-containing protein, partial [Anaeromyxobacteraceae bacterium]|nr:PH domain-containing protein [Anaeromyxobacteraceae bacterium]
DRARALGHTLTDGFFVVRSGSLDRRREALELDGVIGWNLRSTWFQRRAGLTSLTATTAGGRQAVTAIDVPEDRAVEVALAASPDWIAPFVVTAE